MKSKILWLFVIFQLCCPRFAEAQVYDLTNDWSDVNNPNGVWSLYKNPNELFTNNCPDWGSNGTNQKAWADEPYPNIRHVPVWMKATTLNFQGFVDPGTVTVHGAETWRTGTEYTGVVWTSPLKGNVHISGGAWVAKYSNRTMIWEILKNGSSITSGKLTYDDIFDKVNPFDFGLGSGGEKALDISVQKGDKIQLLVYRENENNWSTFVGLKFAITVKKSNFTFVITPPVVTGGNQAIGSVTLPSVAKTDTSISLLSSAPKVASVPASTTILAGKKTATFDVKTSTVKEDTPVTITATLNDVKKSVAILVTPTKLSSFSIKPSSVLGGKTAVGTIALSRPAPVGGHLVSIKSDNPIAVVPVSQVVPEGSKSATFHITTSLPESKLTANIAVSFGGATKSASLIVNPLTPASLTLTPSTVEGGSKVEALLALTGTAPTGGKTVQLRCTNTAGNCPDKVLVAAGKSKVKFYIKTRNPSDTTKGDVFAALGGVEISTPLTITHFTPKIATALSSTSLSGQYGQAVILTAKLTEKSTKKGIANRTVLFYVENSKVGTASTDKNGEANLSYVIDDSLALGDHTLKFEFGGDTLYNPSSTNATLTITRTDSLVTGQDVQGQYGEVVKMYATLKRKTDNKAISGATISYILDSQNIGTATTDANGQATLLYKLDDPLTIGDHTLTLSFDGNAPYSGSTTTVNTKLLYTETKITGADASGKQGEDVELKATLLRATDLAPMKNRLITYFIDGIYAGVATTGNDGVAILTMNISQSAGKHPIKVLYAGESPYLASGDGKATLTVK